MLAMLCVNYNVEACTVNSASVRVNTKHINVSKQIADHKNSHSMPTQTMQEWESDLGFKGVQMYHTRPVFLLLPVLTEV